MGSTASIMAERKIMKLTIKFYGIEHKPTYSIYKYGNRGYEWYSFGEAWMRYPYDARWRNGLFSLFSTKEKGGHFYEINN
jgi:hypothetical protein